VSIPSGHLPSLYVRLLHRTFFVDLSKIFNPPFLPPLTFFFLSFGSILIPELEMPQSSFFLPLILYWGLGWGGVFFFFVCGCLLFLPVSFSLDWYPYSITSPSRFFSGTDFPVPVYLASLRFSGSPPIEHAISFFPFTISCDCLKTFFSLPFAVCFEVKGMEQCVLPLMLLQRRSGVPFFSPRVFRLRFQPFFPVL